MMGERIINGHEPNFNNLPPKPTEMTSEDRKAIVEALEAIASALSFAESDMPIVMSDRIIALHVAIGKLKENGDCDD